MGVSRRNSGRAAGGVTHGDLTKAKKTRLGVKVQTTSRGLQTRIGLPLRSAVDLLGGSARNDLRKKTAKRA